MSHAVFETYWYESISHCSSETQILQGIQYFIWQHWAGVELHASPHRVLPAFAPTVPVAWAPRILGLTGVSGRRELPTGGGGTRQDLLQEHGLSSKAEPQRALWRQMQKRSRGA